MKIVTVNSSSIVKAFRKVVSVFGYDSHDSYVIAPFGDDSCPPKGTKGVKVETDNNSVHAIVGFFNKNLKAQAGEKRIYSIKSDNTESFYIWLKNDGTCEIGGDTDFMVRYSKLEEAFNELKGKYNDLAAKFNTHTHTGVTPGSSATAVPVAQSSQSTANITAAKIEELKTI